MFTENSVFDNKPINGFARVKGTFSVRIPANTTIVVECTGPHIDGDVIVGPLKNGGHHHRNFRTVLTCVTVSKGKLWARVANIRNEDIYLKPRTMIGIVSKCDVENKNSSIGLIESAVSMKYLFRNVKCMRFLPVTMSLRYLKIFISLIAVIKIKHRLPSFSGNTVMYFLKTDIGCTNTVQHRIRLIDNASVSQQYRPILLLSLKK